MVLSKFLFSIEPAVLSLFLGSRAPIKQLFHPYKTGFSDCIARHAYAATFGPCTIFISRSAMLCARVTTAF